VQFVTVKKKDWMLSAPSLVEAISVVFTCHDILSPCLFLLQHITIFVHKHYIYAFCLNHAIGQRSLTLRPHVPKYHQAKPEMGQNFYSGEVPFPSYKQFSTTKNGMWNLMITVVKMLYIHIMNKALI